MRRVAFALLLLVVPLAAVAAQQTVREFTLKHRPASQAVAIVAPLLSPQGSVVLQPRLNTLVVRDTEEAVDRVAAFLAQWDTGPVTYRIEIRLLLASNTRPTPPSGGPHFSAPAADAVREARTPTTGGPHFHSVEDDLRNFFHYNFFTDLDRLRVDAAEGSMVEALAAGQYFVRFRLVPQPGFPDRVQLAGLELLRGPGGAVAAVGPPVLRTTVSLRVGQTSIIGAAPSENAERALVLVLTALRPEPK